MLPDLLYSCGAMYRSLTHEAQGYIVTEGSRMTHQRNPVVYLLESLSAQARKMTGAT